MKKVNLTDTIVLSYFGIKVMDVIHSDLGTIATLSQEHIKSYPTKNYKVGKGDSLIEAPTNDFTRTRKTYVKLGDNPNLTTEDAQKLINNYSEAYLSTTTSHNINDLITEGDKFAIENYDRTLQDIAMKYIAKSNLSDEEKSILNKKEQDALDNDIPVLASRDFSKEENPIAMVLMKNDENKWIYRFVNGYKNSTFNPVYTITYFFKEYTADVYNTNIDLSSKVNFVDKVESKTTTTSNKIEVENI